MKEEAMVPPGNSSAVSGVSFAETAASLETLAPLLGALGASSTPPVLKPGAEPSAAPLTAFARAVIENVSEEIRDEVMHALTLAATCPDSSAPLLDAAPDMLAALNAADEALAQFTAFEDDARHIMGNTNFAIVQMRREQVRAAIAKATGQ